MRWSSRRNIGVVVTPVVVVREPNRTPLLLMLRERLVVGRECEGLLVVDSVVSRRHLELSVVDGALIVADLGSSNGTMIDGAWISTPSELAVGSTVQIGALTIERVADADVVEAEVLDRASRAPNSQEIGVTSINSIVSAVTSESFAEAAVPLDQGTLTIVFSDIESSTQRNVELGDQVWLEVLGRHNEVIRRQLDRYGGTEIKNQGDGFMMSFPGARRALMCMIGVQQELAEHERNDPERSVRVRVGMHTGEVLVEDGDLFGTHVVVAARVADVATGREILVSALSREIVAARGDVVFGSAREAELKGIGTQLVYPIDWTMQLSD
jgi:class 3 adenylate cyclase